MGRKVRTCCYLDERNREVLIDHSLPFHNHHVLLAFFTPSFHGLEEFVDTQSQFLHNFLESFLNYPRVSCKITLFIVALGM